MSGLISKNELRQDLIDELDEYQSHMEGIDIKIGTNTDTAGTTTVFSRLKQIYDHLASVLSSTRVAKIDNLDTTISSRQANWGATSAHANRIDANISSRATQTSVDTKATQASVNTVSTNVGSNADAASATGSVHAKLKDIKANIGTNSVPLVSTYVSNTVQRELIGSSAVTIPATPTGQYGIIQKYASPYDGAVRVSLDHRRVNSNQGFQIRLYVLNRNYAPPRDATSSRVVEYFLNHATLSSLPIGTMISSNVFGGSSSAIFFYNPLQLDYWSSSSDWLTRTFDLYLGKNDVLLFVSDGSNSFGAGNIRNLKVCYDRF